MPHPDREQLLEWVSMIPTGRLRGLSRLTSALLPDGRPLRGIVLDRGLILGRDRQLYWWVGNDPAVQLSADQALNILSMQDIRRVWHDILLGRRARHA